MRESDSPRVNNLAANLFNAKELGLSLKEVATDLIKSENSDIQSHWYHSKKDADLYIWKDRNQNIIKQQISFYGQLMEWNIIEGVRTGLIIEDETTKLNGSALIRFDSRIQSQTAQQGIEIVSHIPGLSNSDKIAVISNFTNSPLFSQMNPCDILARYGLQATHKRRPEWIKWLLMKLGFSAKDK